MPDQVGHDVQVGNDVQAVIAGLTGNLYFSFGWSFLYIFRLRTSEPKSILLM